MGDFQVRREGTVAVISIDDGKANALTTHEFASLERALDEVAKSDARSAVLTGRVGYLSAGLNLKHLGSANVEQMQDITRAMGHAVLKLFTFEKPVVAAVSGHALGGGAMFVLACDVSLFAEGPYKFGLNEVPIGLFVPTYAIELARARLPSERLTEFVVHGRVLSPAESLEWKVAEAVLPAESLLAAALTRAEQLGALSGQGYAMTKQLVRGAGAAMAREKLPGELAGMTDLMKRRFGL